MKNVIENTDYILLVEMIFFNEKRGRGCRFDTYSRGSFVTKCEREVNYYLIQEKYFEINVTKECRTVLEAVFLL